MAFFCIDVPMNSINKSIPYVQRGRLFPVRRAHTICWGFQGSCMAFFYIELPINNIGISYTWYLTARRCIPRMACSYLFVGVPRSVARRFSVPNYL